MIRAVTLCHGDWVFHKMLGKPVQIGPDNLVLNGKPVIGYDFEPIMLDHRFFTHNNFGVNPGDNTTEYLYTEKDKDETSTTPAYVEWYENADTGEHHIAVHGNGCTISFNHNIAVHELQAAMRLCKISLKVSCQNR